MDSAKLYSIREAAELLGTTRERVWYVIRRGYWHPRLSVGDSYALDDDDVAALRKILGDLRKRAKSKPGRLKYLEGDAPKKSAPPESSKS